MGSNATVMGNQPIPTTKHKRETLHISALSLENLWCLPTLLFPPLMTWTGKKYSWYPTRLPIPTVRRSLWRDTKIIIVAASEMVRITSRNGFFSCSRIVPWADPNSSSPSKWTPLQTLHWAFPCRLIMKWNQRDVGLYLYLPLQLIDEFCCPKPVIPP